MRKPVKRKKVRIQGGQPKAQSKNIVLEQNGETSQTVSTEKEENPATDSVSIQLETAQIEVPVQRTGNTRAVRTKFELEKGGKEILTCHEVAEKAWNLAHAFFNGGVGTKEDTISIIEDDIEFLLRSNLSIQTGAQTGAQTGQMTSEPTPTVENATELFNEEEVPELSVVNLRGILSTMEQYGMEQGYVGFYGDDCHFFSAPMHGCVPITKGYVKSQLSSYEQE